MPNPTSDLDAITEFVSERAPEVAQIIEGAQDLWDDHGVVSQPTSILISADGSTQRIGSFGSAGLKVRLERLLAEQQ